jgi:hypothetical protein
MINTLYAIDSWHAKHHPLTLSPANDSLEECFFANTLLLGGEVMEDGGLSKDVAGFLTSHIGSLEQLEVLLLLQRTSPKSWSPDAIANELRVNATSVRGRLEDLGKRGLITAETEGHRYDPRNSADATIRRVADAYRERRVAVISFIFSRKESSMQTLADAFRVKK